MTVEHGFFVAMSVDAAPVALVERGIVLSSYSARDSASDGVVGPPGVTPQVSPLTPIVVSNPQAAGTAIGSPPPLRDKLVDEYIDDLAAGRVELQLTPV